MEELLKKFRVNYQELLTSLNQGSKFGNLYHKGTSECLSELDKNIDEFENLLSEPNKILEHHLNTTIGLYAIDFNPKELIKRFVDSQSDATRLLVEDVEDLVEDWEKWVKDENIGKSPFFQIK